MIECKEFCSFKYIVDLRANENDTEFQHTIWNYWGNHGHWNYSCRINNYDKEWEKNYPLLIKSHKRLIKLMEKILNEKERAKYKYEIDNLPENFSLPVGTHYIFFNTNNEYVVRGGNNKFLTGINDYQLNYYKKIRNYAIKLTTIKSEDFCYIKENKEIEDYEKSIPKSIVNLFHDGKGGNIPLSFPLFSEEDDMYVRRQKTNEGDTKVKDLLPFGEGVILCKRNN